MKLARLIKGKRAWVEEIALEVREALYDHGIIPGVSIELVHRTKTTHSVFKIDGAIEIILEDKILPLVTIRY